MMGTLDFATARAQTAPPATSRKRLHWFFPVVAGVLFAALLVGFAPSFFLRSLSASQPMPLYLYVHGVVLTAWYGLFLVQTALVAASRTALHRRLGLAAVVVAVLLVPISELVVVRAVPRFLSAGFDLNRNPNTVH
jgi:hypothetical protein